MSRVVLSVGANLGDRLAALRTVFAALSDQVVAVSPVYETEPWGPVQQERYLNAVVIAEDEAASAHDWLVRAQAMETAAGRVRLQRWGPRSLDVDVITVDVGGRTVLADHPDLVLPHPRAAERAFVLVPWLDVDPDAVLAGHGRVAELPAAAETAGMRRWDDLGEEAR